MSKLPIKPVRGAYLRAEDIGKNAGGCRWKEEKEKAKELGRRRLENKNAHPKDKVKTTYII